MYEYVRVCTGMYCYIPVLHSMLVQQELQWGEPFLLIFVQITQEASLESFYLPVRHAASYAQGLADPSAACARNVTSVFLFLHAFHEFTYCFFHIPCIRPGLKKFLVFCTRMGVPFCTTCMGSSRWRHDSATVRTTKPCVEQSD